MTQEKHYAYGSGMSGCLFDCGPNFCETEEQAIEGALFIFDNLSDEELSAARENLKNDGIHYFSDALEAGAQYVQVSECNGPMPEDNES
jgi:hypothetical protein